MPRGLVSFFFTFVRPLDMDSSLQVPTQHRRRRWSRASGSLRSASNGSASSRSRPPPPEPRDLPETNAERYLTSAERQLVTLPTPITGWLATLSTPLGDETQIKIAELVRQRRRETLEIAKKRVSRVRELFDEISHSCNGDLVRKANLRQCEVDLNREKLEVPGDPILNFVSDQNWEIIKEWLASMSKYACGKTLLGRGRPRHAEDVMQEFDRTKKEGLQFLAVSLGACSLVLSPLVHFLQTDQEEGCSVKGRRVRVF